MKENIKILHTADIHLKEVGDERWEGLIEIIKKVKEEEVNLLIISGDFFDNNRIENMKLSIRDEFQEAEFDTIILPGNHDEELKNEHAYFGERVKIIDNIEKSIEYDNLMIWGLPFKEMKKKEILKNLTEIKSKMKDKEIEGKENILLYHGQLIDLGFSKGDFGDEGEGRYMPLELKHFEGFDYVLAGHLHRRFRSFDIGKGFFIYPGSPVSVNKREIGKRKVNIFNIGDKPNPVEINTFHYKEQHIRLNPYKSNQFPLKEIEQTVSDLEEKATLLLRIDGYFSEKTLNMTEKEFISDVNKITKGKNVILENIDGYKDISRLEKDGIYKEFLQELDKKETDEDKERIASMFFETMLEVMK